MADGTLAHLAQSGDLSQGFGFLFTRGFVTGMFSHAAYAAVTGFGLGWCIGSTDQWWAARLGVAIGSFVAVWSLHVPWDSPLFEDWFGDGAGALFLVVFLRGLPRPAILLLALRWARRTSEPDGTSSSTPTSTRRLLPPADVQGLQNRTSRRATPP